jgi:hypothetical protein
LSRASSSKLAKIGQIYAQSETIADREKTLVEAISTMTTSNTNPLDFKAFLQQAYKKHGDRFTEELNKVLDDYKILSFVTSDINKELLEFILNVDVLEVHLIF